MTLSDPLHRNIENEAGFNDAITLRRCAENMLNASPSIHAININAHIVSPHPLMIDVDADLTDFGVFQQNLPVTYRCIYLNGKMTSGVWVRGLVPNR